MNEDWAFDFIDQLHESGESEVADAIWRLLNCAYLKDMEGLEGAFPVVLGYARRTNHPWLEIFVRHWHLQAYVRVGSRIHEMLPEAVSLFAMTGRAETRDCPESRCVVQDLSLCYGATDGPGYAQERLAVVNELLARIDPSVRCYCCMATESVDALCHMGKHQEAFDHSQACVTKAREFGSPIDDDDFYWNNNARETFTAALRVRAFDYAQAYIKRMKPGDHDDRTWQKTARARLHLAKGHVRAAARALPEAESTRAADGPTRSIWLASATALSSAGGIVPDADLISFAEEVRDECDENGRYRDAFESALCVASLAMDAGLRSKAEQELAKAEAAKLKLRGSHGADEALAGLHARVVDIPNEQ